MPDRKEGGDNRGEPLHRTDPGRCQIRQLAAGEFSPALPRRRRSRDECQSSRPPGNPEVPRGRHVVRDVAQLSQLRDGRALRDGASGVSGRAGAGGRGCAGAGGAPGRGRRGSRQPVFDLQAGHPAEVLVVGQDPESPRPSDGGHHRVGRRGEEGGEGRGWPPRGPDQGSVRPPRARLPECPPWRTASRDSPARAVRPCRGRFRTRAVV